jgi:hypothetical protein
MLNCRQATRIISQSMDCKVPWHRRLAMRVHLLYCVWCRRYAAQLQILRKAAKGLNQDTLVSSPAKLSDEAKDRMRTRLQEAAKDLPPAD